MMQNSNIAKIRNLQEQGVIFLNPEKVEIRGEISCGKGVVIEVNVILEGVVNLGNNVRIGPNTIIINSSIEDNTEIKAFTTLNNCHIGKYCFVGPHARIRSSVQIEDECQIGNFVEIKNSKIGNNCRINHMAFIGDALLEDDVTIGAGTITCNHNGTTVNETIILKGAYIGSNVNLVAPVKVFENATIGSGSTITDDVPGNKLTLARTRQVSVEGWEKPKK